MSGSGISWAICKSAPRSRLSGGSFLQAGCPSCCPTNSIKALKANKTNSCKPTCDKHAIFSNTVSSNTPAKMLTTVPDICSKWSLQHLCCMGHFNSFTGRLSNILLAVAVSAAVEFTAGLSVISLCH